MRTLLPLAFALAVVACDSKPKAAAEPTPAGTASAAPAAATPATSAPVASAPASAAAAPVASVSAAPAADGPCPPNAKRYDTPRFCVVLPEKTLDISYEEYAAGGDVEIEAPGGTLRFHWEAAKTKSVAAIKTELERADQGFKLVASGEIPGGGWSEIQKAEGDTSAEGDAGAEGDAAANAAAANAAAANAAAAKTAATEHVVRSVVKAGKLEVLCNYTVKAEHVEQARNTCKSMRAY